MNEKDLDDEFERINIEVEKVLSEKWDAYKLSHVHYQSDETERVRFKKDMIEYLSNYLNDYAHQLRRIMWASEK